MSLRESIFACLPGIANCKVDHIIRIAKYLRTLNVVAKEYQFLNTDK